MYGWDRLVLFRHLLAQGVSKTAIAQQLGVHRTTLYSWLRREDRQAVLDLDVVPGAGPPRRQRKRSVPRSTKLAPYKAIIEERLQHYPRLSAVRLFEEIRAAGYTGGKTRVCEFVHTIRPLVPPEPVVRFETEPGLQAQADFAHIRLPWGVRYALVVVLGYSRLLWVKFYPRQDMATLFAGLEDAFRHFGGVPRDVLFDQMRAVITRDLRLEGGTLVENAEFTRFAAHWGFTPRACRPYRAKTKGKVERPIRYLRENFLYGREFIGDADLNGQCEQWLLRVANVRLHQTIQARPLERFTNDEQHTLQSLPSSSYLSLVLRTGTRRTQSGMTPTPIQVAVERRSLHTYAQLAATIAARTGPDRTAVYPTRRWGCPMSTTKSGKAGAPARRDRIREYLAELKLPGSLEVLDAILSDLDGGRLSAAEAIERLLAAQITLRDERRLAIAMRSSRLPALKTLTEFDFGFQPSVKREQLDSLHELGFLERKENVIFLGPPGVGKTHLAISLVVQAARQGRRVYYSTLDDLIASLEQAQQQHKLVHRLRALTTPSVLLVDEIGYTPISQTGAMLFFQLMSRRYEHASTILTSNKGFEDWGHVFGDDVMATALIDRLVHHCHIVNITGNSYRTRNHAELLGGGGLHSHGDVRSSINGHRSPPTLRRRNRPPQGGMLTP